MLESIFRKTLFREASVIAYRKNTSSKQIIKSNSTENNKKIVKSDKKSCGECSPCSSNLRTLCSKQVVGTTSFKS